MHTRRIPRMFQFGVNLVPLNPLPRIAIPTSCFTRHSLSGMSLDKRFENGIDFLEEEIVEMSLDRVLQLPRLYYFLCPWMETRKWLFTFNMAVHSSIWWYPHLLIIAPFFEKSFNLPFLGPIISIRVHVTQTSDK